MDSLQSSGPIALQRRPIRALLHVPHACSSYPCVRNEVNLRQPHGLRRVAAFTRASSLSLLAICVTLCATPRPGVAQDEIASWGRQVFDSAWHHQPFVELAAGGFHTVARRSNGSVVAWGENGYAQCNVPALPSGLSYVEIAAGWSHTVGRRSDGSVVAWGYNNSGQCVVPPPPVGLSYVEISAGGGHHGSHNLGRLSDGTVMAWGFNHSFQCNVPVLPAGLSYVEVAAGAGHSVARVGDGSVLAWGSNASGE